MPVKQHSFNEYSVNIPGIKRLLHERGFTQIEVVDPKVGGYAVKRLKQADRHSLSRSHQVAIGGKFLTARHPQTNATVLLPISRKPVLSDLSLHDGSLTRGYAALESIASHYHDVNHGLHDSPNGLFATDPLDGFTHVLYGLWPEVPVQRIKNIPGGASMQSSFNGFKIAAGVHFTKTGDEPNISYLINGTLLDFRFNSSRQKWVPCPSTPGTFPFLGNNKTRRLTASLSKPNTPSWRIAYPPRGFKPDVPKTALSRAMPPVGNAETGLSISEAPKSAREKPRGLLRRILRR